MDIPEEQGEVREAGRRRPIEAAYLTWIEKRASLKAGPFLLGSTNKFRHWKVTRQDRAVYGVLWDPNRPCFSAPSSLMVDSPTGTPQELAPRLGLWEMIRDEVAGFWKGLRRLRTTTT